MASSLTFQLLLVVAISSLALGCAQDQLNGIRKCYQTYLAGFNTTMGDVIPEYWQYLHDPRENWILSSFPSSQAATCVLGNNLISCLTPYRSCMSAKTYDDLGAFNSSESNDYQIDLAVTQYQCNAGYNILMQNFYCLEDCRSKNQDKLDKCDANMKINAVLYGLCNAAQINANCQNDIMAACCGANTGIFMCNTFVAGFSSLDADCANNGKLKCAQPKLDMEELFKINGRKH